MSQYLGDCNVMELCSIMNMTWGWYRKQALISISIRQDKFWFDYDTYDRIMSYLMSLENGITWRLLSYKGDWGNDWLEVVENVNLAICFWCIEIIKLWNFCWYDIYMFWLDLIINSTGGEINMRIPYLYADCLFWTILHWIKQCNTFLQAGAQSLYGRS